LSKINRHPVRRTAAGVLAGALALSGAVATALPANAAAGFALERVQGNDRYETSASIAAAFGPSTSVILASGESGRTPDALAANFLAGVRNAPVLLTRRDTTPEPILTRLNALRAAGTTRITVVGGTVAVSDTQVTALRALGFTVDRVFGANRYATAAAIAVEGETGEAQEASNIGILASGVSTIDALAGGPLAYKGRHPLLLTTRDGVPGATLAALRSTGVTSVFVLGGEAVVSQRVITQLAAAGITVRERLFGADRSATSVAIANRLIADFGFSANTFNLASGVNEGIDALGGAALSGKENRVLLITNTATSAAPVTAFATARAATLTQVGRIFGGTAAVAASLETAIETAGGSAASNQTFTVTPADAVTLTLADEAATNTATVRDADNRTFTATGLTAGTTYRITLVNSSNITVGSNGQATFLPRAEATSSTGFAADTGTDIADIVSVNGASQGANTNSVTVSPVNGTITFTIDGTGVGSVTPVLYINGGVGGTATTGGTSPFLEVAAPTASVARTAPTESFGLGGRTTFLPGQLASGAIPGGGAGSAVSNVNKESNVFVVTGGGTAGTVSYDANDLFSVDGVSVGLAAFEAALSTGDVVRGTFTRDAGGVSNFQLTDAAPAAPATVTATVGTGASSNDVTVNVGLAGQTPDSVLIERAPVAGGNVGTFVTLAQPTTDAVAGGDFTYLDNDVPAGTYRYRASIVIDGDAGPTTTSADRVVTAPSTDVARPTAVDTRLVNNAGNPLLIESGDSFSIAFSEVVDTPAANATLRVTDADGSAYFLTAGQGVTFSRNASAVTIGGVEYAANRVVTVVVNTLPAASTAGTSIGLNIPATIVQSAGITDAAGNTFDVSSGDVVIDSE